MYKIFYLFFSFFYVRIKVACVTVYHRSQNGYLCLDTEAEINYFLRRWCLEAYLYKYSLFYVAFQP